MVGSTDTFRREVTRGEEQVEFLTNKIQKHFYENGCINEMRIIYVGLEFFRMSVFKRQLSFPADLARFPNPVGEAVVAAIEKDIAAFARDDEEKDFLYGAALESIARLTSGIFQVDYQRKHRMSKIG